MKTIVVMNQTQCALNLDNLACSLSEPESWPQMTPSAYFPEIAKDWRYNPTYWELPLQHCRRRPDCVFGQIHRFGSKTHHVVDSGQPGLQSLSPISNFDGDVNLVRPTIASAGPINREVFGAALRWITKHRNIDPVLTQREVGSGIPYVNSTMKPVRPAWALR